MAEPSPATFTARRDPLRAPAPRCCEPSPALLVLFECRPVERTPPVAAEAHCDYNDHMETVGARELKTRLGTYLRRVREGLTLIITDRGRPVAELRPLAEGAYSEEEALLELAAKGIVTLGTGNLPPRTPIKIGGGSLSDQIIEDREDRI